MAEASTTSCLTLSPIWRHWSISQIPTVSYGWGIPRFLKVNAKPSGTPASRRSRRASARLAAMSRP